MIVVVAITASSGILLFGCGFIAGYNLCRWKEQTNEK